MSRHWAGRIAVETGPEEWVRLLQARVDVKVREMIAQLELHGWYQVAQTGSHRQFKHPVHQGRVTVAGREGSDLTMATLRSIYHQAGLDWSGRKR